MAFSVAIALSVVMLLLASPAASQDDDFVPPLPVKDPPLTPQQVQNLGIPIVQQATIAVATTAARPARDITPSVFVFSLNEVSGNTSKCITQVNRAKLFNTPNIQFVLTNYWQMPANAQVPSSYCLVNYTNVNNQSTPQCLAYRTATRNTTVQQLYYTGVRACVQHALNQGFTGHITFNPRLDQWPGGLWRHYLAYDPLANYTGASYYNTMLLPLAQIARDLRSRAGLWRLALGGEHAYTYAAFPGQWITVLNNLKAVVAGEH